MREYARALTSEDLIRRYDLENLKNDRKTIKSTHENLTKTDKILAEFVASTVQDLETIKNQIDGKITTWFFSGEPSLTNEPASNWVTNEEKANHLGDLYYDKDTGYSYRWSDDNGYKWIKIIDSATSEALAIANAAKDTADRKRQIFVTTPMPPYDIGDIWLKEDKVIYRCKVNRASGDYNSSDWCPATEYTDDTYAKNVEAALNQFKSTVEENYTTNVLLATTRDSILGSVESDTKRIETYQQNIYNELSGKLDKCETVENVTLVKQKVEELTTSTERSITILNDIQTNGVSQVRTENNYTFNKEGLTIDETNSKAKNLLNNNGMAIIDKTGGSDRNLLFAGYSEELGESIVEADNMTVKVYLVVGEHSRFEDYIDEEGNAGTGCFSLNSGDSYGR